MNFAISHLPRALPRRVLLATGTGLHAFICRLFCSCLLAQRDSLNRSSLSLLVCLATVSKPFQISSRASLSVGGKCMMRCADAVRGDCLLGFGF